MNHITALAPAKINLTLDVKPKTLDAHFHEIETLYHLVNWGDTITIERSDRFEIHGNFDCPAEDNLIYKTWEIINNLALRDRSRQKTETGLRELPAVKVTVNKQIPTQAGLGGGSSNAATFIQAYSKLFNLGAIPEALTQSLAGLGKDIPFFLSRHKCALGTHYGEIIRPVDFNFSGQPIYLYFPPSKSKTAEAYAQLTNFNTHFTPRFLAEPKLAHCGNTFQQIFEQNSYSKLILSGSGSTFFSFEKIDTPVWKVIKTQLL